jgi:hypothetical protein
MQIYSGKLSKKSLIELDSRLRDCIRNTQSLSDAISKNGSKLIEIKDILTHNKLLVKSVEEHIQTHRKIQLELEALKLEYTHFVTLREKQRVATVK